ncbi:hypothetical protein [Massilia sp. TWP1-3-3]|uniref:hypothetical protein n=1 Tax=Massilia sp. TWP1-3-3 TaxID=2804573 RepID=UPI003CEFDE04
MLAFRNEITDKYNLLAPNSLREGELGRAITSYLLASPLAGCIRRPLAHSRLADSFQNRRFFNDYLLIAPHYRWWLRQVRVPFFAATG